MGNAAFYYYPAGTAAGLETIDLGEGVTDLQVNPIRQAATAYTMSGRMYRTVETARLQITIANERFASAAVAQALESMSSHLELGGAVAFTADTAKVWAGFTKAAPSRGDTVLATYGNTFSGLASGSVAANDVIAFQSPNPSHYVEYARVDSVAVNTITLQDAIRYNHPEALTLIRYRDFYPLLRMPASGLGASFVTHDHRLTYTLDITLVDDLPSLYEYASEVDGSTVLTSATAIDALLGNQSGETSPFPENPGGSTSLTLARNFVGL